MDKRILLIEDDLDIAQLVRLHLERIALYPDGNAFALHAAPLDERARGPVCVLATLPGEQHGLGLLMAAIVAAAADMRVRLAGTDPARIFDEVARLLGDPAAYWEMASAENPYGDGQAARRIRERIEAELQR